MFKQVFKHNAHRNRRKLPQRLLHFVSKISNRGNRKIQVERLSNYKIFFRVRSINKKRKNLK